MATKGILRVCEAGHKYYKSSDCPTCPVCEHERKPVAGFLSILPAPARRAMETAGITTVSELARWSEFEILSLHGMGPASIPKLKEALQSEKRAFRKDNIHE